MSYFASVWFENGAQYGAHVDCWIDDAGVITTELNLMDGKGGRPIPKRPTIAVKDAMRQAIAEAEGKRDYADKRRRITPIKDLEFAFCVTIGRGGHSIYMDQSPDSTCHLSGYGLSADELREIDRLNIPFIDSTTIPDGRITKTISLPMLPRRPDEYDAAPWSALSHAPIEVIAAAYESLGATVRNIKPDYDRLNQCAGWTARGLGAMIGYQTGNSAMLGTAMMSTEKL